MIKGKKGGNTMKVMKRGKMNYLLRFAASAVVIFLFVNVAFSRGILDPKLQNKMQTETGPFEVIVTFKDLADVNSLSTLVVKFLPLTALPMAGTILTTSQIKHVLDWETVDSVYFNDKLEYYNWDAAEITGGHYVHKVMGLKGKDVTVCVLDSGIDATHPDLKYGEKVIQNVKIVGDLGLLGGLTLFIEGVPNTDTSSGHGTHCAGTVAGLGTASCNDERDPGYYYYDGIAPEAKLVGLGTGETLFIFHALIGFDYAIANRDRFNISVISNSWGGGDGSDFDPYNPINKASYEAYSRGITVLFAASNSGPEDNTLNRYAIAPWVINVAAGTKNKELASFSSRGVAGDEIKHPDVTAPGESIISTRGLLTPLGALDPVINPAHPEYYTYYVYMSGTSMATPFVAGSTALLLSVNSNLSPDQVEDIITKTADPMPAYAYHEVGSGYINVQRAVEAAQEEKGDRLQFLTGDTKWSSRGNWVIEEEDNSYLGYYGKWRTKYDENASGETYRVVEVKGKKKKPALRIAFYGSGIKIGYPTGPKGGNAEVILDDESQGTISYYSESEKWDVRSAFTGLSNTTHTLELRALNGEVYIDNIYLDGELYPSNTQFIEETTTYSGTMGPSVEGIPETHTIPFEVDDDSIQISAELSWSPAADLDFYLLDPDGKQVAMDASMDNPEKLSCWVSKPGTYTYKIVGYLSVAVNYTVTSTLTKAITTE